MHHSKAKNGIIAFKVDLEKACDRVSRDFLELTRSLGFWLPEQYNFPHYGCVKSSNLSILWNGEKMESFKSSRGLRQCDPLSHYQGRTQD